MSWLSGSAFEILTIRVANFLKIELEELSQGILRYVGQVQDYKIMVYLEIKTPEILNHIKGTRMVKAVED